MPNFQIGDLLGGSLTALLGVLAGVVDARQSGRGRYVDVSMTDAVFAHTIFPLLAVLGLGHALPRGEDVLSGGMPSYGVYATSDGRHFAVSAMEPKFWQGFCEAVGRPDLKPFAFATGYSDRSLIPERFATAPVIRKPFDARMVVGQVAELLRGAPAR